MALPDYHFKDKESITGVLQERDQARFTNALSSVRIGIHFGEDSCGSEDGKHLLDLLTRLVARFYPYVSFSCPPSCESYADELLSLAKRINPLLETGPSNGTQMALVVGSDAPNVSAPAVFMGCKGWQAFVGSKRAYTISNTGNPYGAGFAACLGVASAFRFLFMPTVDGQLDEDVVFPIGTDAFPEIQQERLHGPLVLAGVGAIGNGVAWALSRTSIIGDIWLVDPEILDLGNLQRYVLCERSDEGESKVNIIGRNFSGGLSVKLHDGDWGSFVGDHGYSWDRVLTALDTVKDRRAVQACLPEWIANAWTRTGGLGVSTHSFVGEGACLACLYLSEGQSKNYDEIIAEGLGVPQMLSAIRGWLQTGKGIDRAFTESVEKHLGMKKGDLRSFVNQPVLSLWTHICGTGAVPVDDNRTLGVPLAFESALAGVYLAAVATADIMDHGQCRNTAVLNMNLLRPFANPEPQPRNKNGSGRCICEDEDYINVYNAKYLDGAQVAVG